MEAVLVVVVLALLVLSFIAGMTAQKERMLTEMERNNERVENMRRVIDELVAKLGDNELRDELNHWMRD